MLGRLREKLSYANIVATLALFIGLGGVSYAAVTLPANSVGAKQLQPNAVGLGNLRFPLGTAGLTSNASEELKGICCGGCAVPPPVVPVHGGPTPGREVTMAFPRAGDFVVSGIVGLTDESAVQTPVPITLELIIDRRPALVDEVTVIGGQVTQVPIQTVRKVSAGKHTTGVAVRANGCLNGPGHLRLTHVSLVASASPSAVTK
jgi:hypothetical protein